MHPAPSVIIFTALSGLGFGLLAWLGIGAPQVAGWAAFFFYFIGFALSVGGLAASAFHLGNPQRALKAFSQWQTSWLSREAWISLAALLITAPYAIGLIFFETRLFWLGWLGAALSIATVFATSMIYAQLKTVPRWNHATTPLLFVTYAVSGGALLANQLLIAGFLLLFCTALQALVWYQGDRRFAARATTIQTATGLGRIGKVRQLEAPHTGDNYLLREFVFVLARRHSRQLRLIALLLLGIIPAFTLLFTSGLTAAALAITLHVAGLIVARWLFFAEAEHVVGLYYDKR